VTDWLGTLIGYNLSNLYYHRAPIDDEPIASRLKTLAAERPRWDGAGCLSWSADTRSSSARRDFAGSIGLWSCKSGHAASVR
jgi:hypothetical protein